MRIIATLLVLEVILWTFVLSVDFDTGTSDHPEFSLESHQECTLTHRTYRPVKDGLVVTVSHNERRLWNTREGEQCKNIQIFSRGQSPLFLHIVYTKDGILEDYYWVFRREWIMCMKSEYDEALENERLQTINIDSPSAFLGDLQKNGNLAKEETFVANEKCKIIKVEDGGRTVWEAGKNDKLLSYMLLSDKNKVDLLHLVMTNGEEFYELSNDGYKRITKKEFKERDDKMSTYKLAIDINDVKSDKYDMSEYKCAGFPATSFTPKRHLSFVTDDGTFICSFASGVKIKKVTVYKGSTKKFMDVEHVKDGINYHAYFIKGQGSWEKATMEDYYAALRRQPEFDTSSPTSLNIRSPDEKMCRIEDTGNPVYERVIIPKNEFRVTKVYDSATVIWEAETTEYLLKATVYIENGEHALITLKYADVEKHFERSDSGSWKKIKEGVLKSKVKAIKDASSANPPDNIIDVSKFDDLSESEQNGIPTLSFIPTDKINGVYDGDVLVCKISEETKVIKVLLHKAKRCHLIDVQIHKNDKDFHVHFIGVGKQWRVIEKESLTRLLQMPYINTSESPTTKQTNVTLDLLQVDETKFVKEKSGSLLIVFPKEGHKLVKIIEGREELWTASGEEKCISIWIDYKDDELNLAHILVERQFHSEHKHFEKSDGKWLPITEEAYKKAQGK